MADDRHDHFGKDGTERSHKRLVVDWTRVASGLEGLDPDSDHEIRVRREVIPVVLVPGMFGTRLHTHRGEPVWEPCTTLLPSSPGAHLVADMFLRLGLLWSSPGQRRRLLVGERFDPDHLQVSGAAAHRGWQALAADAYGDVLRRLERHPWSDALRLCFELPAHGFGYNWTDDHLHTGELLSRHLRELVSAYEAQGRQCRRVILVAHGSGGLAARAACTLHGAREVVLGVFHGAQPALGAPAMYNALKAGFARSSPHEELAADLLGDTGDRVADLLCRMPGPIQTLPGEGYQDSSGERLWLRFQGADGAPVSALPGGDPWTGVYQQHSRYWGLPASAAARDGDDGVLTRAQEFHRRLGDLHHPNTYHALGRGRATAESVTFRLSPRARKKQYGQLKLVPVGSCDADIITGAVGHHRCVHGKGRFSATLAGEGSLTLEVALQGGDGDGDGDGMVPSSSARAPAPDAGASGGRVPRCKEFEGVEHFSFFNHGPVLDHLTAVIEQVCGDYIRQRVEVGHGR